MTQSVIKNRIENMRLLVQKLKKYFTYVSVLGCDVQSQAVRADKRVTTFNEQPETDRGFVIRMYGGDCVYEYALTDIPEVTDALAEEIAQKVKLPASAAAKVIPPVALADEPLKRDFERDSDVDEVTTQQLIGTAVDLKQRVLERDNRIVNAACIFRIMRVSKVFVSENRTLTQSYAYVNGYFRAKRLSLKIYFTPCSFLNLWSARRENSLIICTSFAIYGRPLKRYRSCWNFVKSLSPLYSGSAISLK